MKTVGTILKEAREAKDVSLDEIAQTTKIKEKFLTALEENNWSILPNFSITRGFTKAYADSVGVDSELALALLRRDFPYIADKPANKIESLLDSRPILTPRATFFAIVALALILVLAYLVRQYIIFSTPPSLETDLTVEGEKVVVSGKTIPSATVQVNRQPVLVDDEGNFSLTLKKDELGSVIEIKAISRTGKETIVKKPVD